MVAPPVESAPPALSEGSAPEASLDLLRAWGPERGRAARKLGAAPRAHLPTTEAPPRPARQLESELAAIDRILDSAGKELGGAAAVGPGVQPLTSSGLVALAAVRREAEEAAAAAAAEMEGQ